MDRRQGVGEWAVGLLIFITSTAENLVVIMKAVGFCVSRLSHPGKACATAFCRGHAAFSLPDATAAAPAIAPAQSFNPLGLWQKQAMDHERVL